MNWINEYIEKPKIVKMRKCNKGKQPIISLNTDQVEKLRNGKYQDKNVFVEPYVPLTKENENEKS